MLQFKQASGASTKRRVTWHVSSANLVCLVKKFSHPTKQRDSKLRITCEFSETLCSFCEFPANCINAIELF